MDLDREVAAIFRIEALFELLGEKVVVAEDRDAFPFLFESVRFPLD